MIVAPPPAPNDHASIQFAMPPTFTDDDVRKIAALARLDLSPAEVDVFSKQLADILAYADAIQQVDTTGVPPTSHVLARGPAWRADDPGPSLERDDVLREAPDAAPAAGVFRVPKVL
jgi:aspartyl-tRNA(Asn)/glutamyl-tRNA(Gln) amidotransferase subunit C